MSVQRLGATGYTALELLRILLRHPQVEISALTSRQEGSPHVSAVHPQLTDRLDLNLEDIPPEAVAAKSDCVFSCLPHAASAAMVVKILESGKQRMSKPFLMYDGLPSPSRQQGIRRTGKSVVQGLEMRCNDKLPP